MSRNTIRGRQWDDVAAMVKERDGYRCVACGATDDLTVDHVHPVDLFTTDDWEAGLDLDPDNLATLCRSCNGRKGNKLDVRVAWYSPRWFPDGIAPVFSQTPAHPGPEAAFSHAAN